METLNSRLSPATKGLYAESSGMYFLLYAYSPIAYCCTSLSAHAKSILQSISVLGWRVHLMSEQRIPDSNTDKCMLQTGHLSPLSKSVTSPVYQIKGLRPRIGQFADIGRPWRHAECRKWQRPSQHRVWLVCLQCLVNR